MSELDAAAFFVFQNCEQSPGFWNWLSGPFGGFLRTGLIYSEVEKSAARHGFVMDGDFEDRVKVMERWLLHDDNRRRKKREKEQAPAGQETVN